MRWWLLIVALVLAWWLWHRHLTRRARKLGLPGLGSVGPGSVKAPCGCGGDSASTPAGGPVPSSPTASVNQTLPASTGGTLPSQVGDGGPAALALPTPNMGLFQ